MQPMNFTRLEFAEGLRAEAARQNVRMDERTLDEFLDVLFIGADGRPVYLLMTSTFPTYVAAFIDELRYVARMNRISAHYSRFPVAGKVSR